MYHTNHYDLGFENHNQTYEIQYDPKKHYLRRNHLLLLAQSFKDIQIYHVLRDLNSKVDKRPRRQLSTLFSNTNLKMTKIVTKFHLQDHMGHSKARMGVEKGGVHSLTPPCMYWKHIIINKGEKATSYRLSQETTITLTPSIGYTKWQYQKERMGHPYVSPHRFKMVQTFKQDNPHVSPKGGISLQRRR